MKYANSVAGMNDTDEKLFFVIDSERLAEVSSNFYGFAVEESGIYNLCNLDQGGERLSGCGCYLCIERTEEGIWIRQDIMGSFALYLFQKDAYFAVSNSFYLLAQYIRDRFDLHLNREYAEHLMTTKVVGLSCEETLIREITVIPAGVDVWMGFDQRIVFDRKMEWIHSVALDSEGGMQLLDMWHDKWVHIIRMLAKNTKQIWLDLSGGIDTRLVLLLFLDSGIDLNQVYVHSSHDKEHTHEEDYSIASDIADALGFQLNQYSCIDEERTYFTVEEVNTHCNLVKLGFHKEFGLPTNRRDKKTYHFCDFGGEMLRYYWEMDREGLIKQEFNETKRFSAEIRGELQTSNRKILENSFSAIDQEKTDQMANPSDVYRNSYARNHFGKTIVEDMLCNIDDLAPLMDPMLHRLTLVTPDCDDKNLLIAVIFTRYAGQILQFGFDSGRSLDKKTLMKAELINKKYKRKSMSHPLQETTFVLDADCSGVLKKRTRSISNKIVEEYLLQEYKSEYFRKFFGLRFPDELYRDAMQYFENGGFYPTRHIAAILAVTRVMQLLMDSRQNKNNAAISDLEQVRIKSIGDASGVSPFEYRTDLFLIYGIQGEIERWYGALPQLKEKIGACIDPKGKGGWFNDHAVFSPEVLTNRIFDDFYVVVAVDEDFETVCTKLETEYGISKDRVLRLRSWIAGLLENEKMKLRPVEVRLEASTLCQLNCTGCFMRKFDNGTLGSGSLSLEDFGNFIRINPYLRHIEFSNSGEPFLNPDICSILKICHDLQIETTFSNGCNFNMVSEEVLESIVKYGVKHMSISIDGASQEIYSIYRRNGNYDRVIDNIRKLNKLKKEYQTEYPYLQWQFILMTHNECDIKKAKQVAGELGMEIRYKLDWTPGYSPADPDMVMSETGLSVFSRTEILQKTGKLYLDLCSETFFSPQLNWDGRLLGCCSAFRSDWGVNCFRDYAYSLERSVNDEIYRKGIIALLSGGADGEGMPENVPCTICGTWKLINKIGNATE